MTLTTVKPVQLQRFYGVVDLSEYVSMKKCFKGAHKRTVTMGRGQLSVKQKYFQLLFELCAAEVLL